MANNQKKVPEAKEVVKEEVKTSKPNFPQVHYIGPSIRGVITMETTYADGVPTEIVKEIATRLDVPQPMVEVLFVPIEKVSEVREKLKTQSKYTTCRNAVVAALNK